MSRRQGFWSVAFAFTAVMAYSAVPAPLYVIYGFASLTTTVVFSVYAVGVVAGLFLAGHVSDWYGRRRVLVPALAVGLASGVFFLAFRDAGWLVVGRLLNGLSVGAAAATATAWLQELGGPSRRTEVVATAANLGGLGLGPLLAGVLAQWVGAPLVVPYVVSLAAVALGMLLVCFAPETRPATPHDYRPQSVSVPRAARAQFFAACTGAAIAFATFGLFTSLAPKFLAGTLHHGSRALAGAAACAVFGAAVAAQLLTAERSRRELLAGGVALVPLGLGLVVLAVWLAAPSLDLFLLGGIVAGAGGGLLFKGGVATVAAIAAEEHRAEALAGLFLLGYLGLAVPVIGLGIVSDELSARTSLLIFAALLGGGVAAAAPTLLRRRDPLRA
jgi:predicted MFS family arabinose efflux permease